MQNLSSIKAVVVSAPSGGGKNTIINELLKKNQRLAHSISTTTRGKRPYEQEGTHYYFIDKSQFEEKIAHNDFLEWAPVLDHYYGTTLAEIEKILGQDKVPILDIDIQGALQIKEKFAGVLLLFIEPPSLEALRERLQKRQSETAEQIEKRLLLAEKELLFKSKFDFAVVNDDLALAIEKIENIINSYLQRSQV